MFITRNTPEPAASDINKEAREKQTELQKVKRLHESLQLFDESRKHFKKSEALRECATEGHTHTIKVPFLLFFEKKVCGRCGTKM